MTDSLKQQLPVCKILFVAVNSNLCDTDCNEAKIRIDYYSLRTACKRLFRKMNAVQIFTNADCHRGSHARVNGRSEFSTVGCRFAD